MKLADFGFAVKVLEVGSVFGVVGPTEYVAP